jgi:hypothetical protein
MARNVVATILVLMLTGCVGSQNNRQAEKIQQDMPRSTIQLPVRDALPSPAAAAASEKQSEPRAEVVPLPADVEVDSTASNNANQQSATGLANVQIAKIAESVDASLVKLDSKIVAQNEMVATLQNSMTAQANAYASLRADVSAIAQAGIGNQQSSATAGRDVTTQFSDGMERLMVQMVSVIYWIAAAFVGTYFASLVSVLIAFFKLQSEQARLREQDEKRDDENMRQAMRGVRA